MVGRYGIKIESSSSSPTAKYANFLSILEIARMYPEQIGAEVVIENSTLANKDVILQQVRVPYRHVSETRKSADAVSSLKQEKNVSLKQSRDFVNTLTKT
jgi:hypothetical protein